ncbi:HAMP domain-containing histidine kinase [Bacillus sp. YZJH907-2]|uniref:histidine kinase n=1 Tax=Halalkalibacter suaedae TaxID=2822140 RepID=A0A941AMG5_9BACI|nr:HAMP domain-containing histidine kinase [Bacillus suaedae]
MIYLLSSVLAIISCISFPITIMNGYLFDLRLVALTIGGLYGGIPVAILLTLVTVAFRFMIGGSGAFATVIVVTILLIILSGFTAYFSESSLKRKVLIGSCLSVLALIIALVNSTIIFGASFSNLFILIHIVLTLSISSLIIYLYEVFQDNLVISKRIIKAEKMEVVSHLASSVSHEVRNPLTVVRGFLQLMQQQDIPLDQREKFLAISISEIDRANDIIRNYLTFAKPSPENNEEINVKEEVEAIIEIITPLANMNGVEIVKQIDHFMIYGEKQMFQQCLINITKNCIEAMPEKGKLVIKTKSEENGLVLVISDNGKGMTEEQLSRLGEPYFTTKGREGTGLGMLTVIKIIELLNGKLNVTSKVNEGTNFYIHLPISESPKTL